MSEILEINLFFSAFVNFPYLCFNPELPESKTLYFDCDVQIKMDFAAEFSNVLVIYTSIVKKPGEMRSCQAHITNLPLVRGLCLYFGERNRIYS